MSSSPLALRFPRLPLVSPLLIAIAAGCPGTSAPKFIDVEVRVRIAVDPTTESPVVVLQETDGDRSLPIWIGPFEARSIYTTMQKIQSPRPNPHDLAASLLVELHARVDRVVVTRLVAGTFFAELVIRRGRQHLAIDARPSDAIAVALRAQAPVFVRAQLFEAAGAPQPTPPPSRKLDL